MDRSEYDGQVRDIHLMMARIGYRPWNTEVATLLSSSVTNLCGSKTGDLIGQYSPTIGWVIDIQGRRAQASDFAGAVEAMRAWSWVL